METKGGNVFYLIIDRDDEGAQTVHFLNQVDEADLLALMEDGEAQEAPAVCTCTEKCQAGAVNTSCEVCAVNMAECAGAEPEPEPEPEPEAEKSGGMGPGAGGAGRRRSLRLHQVYPSQAGVQGQRRPGRL